MQYLKKAKEKFNQTVEQAQGSIAALTTANQVQDEQLSAYKARVDRLAEMVKGMRKSYMAYASAITAMGGSAVAVSSNISKFYKSADSRQKLVGIFSEVNYKIDSLGVELFKEQFGWEILKVKHHCTNLSG